MQQHVSSSDPQWTSPTTPGDSHTPRKRVLRQQTSAVSTDGLSDVALSDGESPSGSRVHVNGHVSHAGLPLAGVPPPLPPPPPSPATQRIVHEMMLSCVGSNVL